jgi:hypothetical protein
MKHLRTLFKILAWLLVLALLGLLVIWLAQGMLMYPGKPFSGGSTDFATRIQAVQNRGFAAVHIEAGAPKVRVRGLWSPCKDGTTPALLWMHERGSDITDTLSVLGPMQELKFHVLALEYPGYGDADGETTEAEVMARAEAAFSWLWSREEVAPRRVFVGGIELGAAVALKLAARTEAAGVIAFATLPDMEDGVSEKLKGLPVGFLLKDRYSVEPALAGLTAPVLFVHGSADPLVPGWRIDSIASKVSSSKVLAIGNAGRTDLVQKMSREDWAEVGSFIFEGLK